MRFFFTGYLADNRMVLTRTALEKISKNYLILLFTENNNKPNITIIEVANKLAKVCETLERMGSQQAVSKAVNDSICKYWLDWKDNAGEMHSTLGMDVLRSLGLLIILRKKRYATCLLAI